MCGPENLLPCVSSLLFFLWQENGKIVETGDASLAKELETGGYAAIA